jgi:hypothetical protein
MIVYDWRNCDNISNVGKKEVAEDQEIVRGIVGQFGLTMYTL